MTLFTDEYLEHHGILGQKWGVRRFQNKDGSLTELGRKRQKKIVNSFSETSPAVDHGKYLEYPKGSVVGRCGTVDYDPNYATYLYTNNQDRKKYFKIFNKSGDEELQRVFVTTKPIKRPEVVEQFKILDAFMKANADRYPWFDGSVFDEPYEFWRDHIDSASQLSAEYFNHLKSKGYSAVLDYRDWCTKGVDDPIILFDHSALGFGNPAKIQHHDTRTTEMQLFTDEYLEHHGILGQKWGVRRFQNKDGSLTSAGRKRLLGKDSVTGDIVKRVKQRHEDKVKAKADAAEKAKPHEDYLNARNKPVSQMTNQELKAGYDRLKMESLYKAEYAKQHKETPKEYVKRVTLDAAKKHGATVAEYMVGKAINKAFGDEVIKNLGSPKENKKAADEVMKELKLLKKSVDDLAVKQDKPVEPKTEEKKPTIKERALKVKDSVAERYASDAAMKANLKYMNSQKPKNDDDDKVYEGEVVFTTPNNYPQLENLRYDTSKSKRRR